MTWSDWPDPYLPANDPTGSPKQPTWSKAQTFAAGEALASMLLSQAADAEDFRAIVERAKLNGGEHVREYEAVIGRAYDLAAIPDFNSNDFANVFRVAWLLIGRALACLMNANPHGDWGDPPANGSTHFEDEPSQPLFYHYVPNATGYYAVSTLDVSMPSTGI